MGDGSAKLRVLIPTTTGLSEVVLLTEEDAAVGRSVVCIGGTTETAAIAAGYHAFVARPTGIIESLFGHSCYRLDVSAGIDAGTSWQLGVLAAHALHAEGRLAEEGDVAGGVLWATGSVRSVDLTVGGVNHVPEKLAVSLPRLRQEADAGRRVIVAIPAQNTALVADDLRAELAACKIALIELGDVRPLWTALSVAPPESSQRAAASNPMQDKTVVPQRRRVAWAAALVLLGAASAATYVLVRPTALPRPQPESPVDGGSAIPRSETRTRSGAERAALVPQEVPFISQDGQARIRAAYLPAPDYKALVVDHDRAFFSIAQPDEKTAVAVAMAACQEASNSGSPGPCELYASGNVVVSRRGRPPMPPQPWFVHDSLVERPFVAAEVPLVSDPLKRQLERFQTRRASKALVLSPTGVLLSHYGESSPEQAGRRALERCGDTARVACMIIALDDSFVVPIPKSAKVVGFYRPDAINAVAAELREGVVRQLASSTKGWSALAVGARGRIGIETGAATEQVAIEGSMQACTREDRECRIAVIGPFLVEPKP